MDSYRSCYWVCWRALGRSTTHGPRGGLWISYYINHIRSIGYHIWLMSTTSGVLIFWSLQNNSAGTVAPQWRRQERPFWQMKSLEAGDQSHQNMVTRCHQMEITMQQQQEANGRCRKGRMTGKSALHSVKGHQEQQERLTDKLLRSKENVHYHPDKRKSLWCSDFWLLICTSYTSQTYATLKNNTKTVMDWRDYSRQRQREKKTKAKLLLWCRQQTEPRFCNN